MCPLWDQLDRGHNTKGSKDGSRLLSCRENQEQVHFENLGLGAGVWLKALAPPIMDSGNSPGRQRRESGAQLQLSGGLGMLQRGLEVVQEAAFSMGP